MRWLFRHPDYDADLDLWVKTEEFDNFPKIAEENGHTPEQAVNQILDAGIEELVEYSKKADELYEEIFGVKRGEDPDLDEEDLEWAEDDYDDELWKIHPGPVCMYAPWGHITEAELERRGWTRIY